MKTVHMNYLERLQDTTNLLEQPNGTAMSIITRRLFGFYDLLK